MWNYLQAAFWARPHLPALGRIPLNALVLLGFVLLGFGHPGFWLAGAALEATYLYALTTHDRFRRLVDAEATSIETESTEKQRETLVSSLIPPRRHRLAAIDAKCARVLTLQQETGTSDILSEANQGALQRLNWIYLKLLIAEQNLITLDSTTTRTELHTRIANLETELAEPDTSRTLTESRQATLKILHQRLANLDHRQESLEEIASDLTRIDAQIDLAIEHAGMRGEATAISTNISLASQLLDDTSLYGDTNPHIASLEKSYAP